MTDRKGLGVDQIKGGVAAQLLRGRLPQGPDHARSGVPASHPLLSRAQTRKGGTVMGRDQAISLLQTRHPPTAWQQRESQHFGIGKTGRIRRRLSPVHQVRMSGQKIIDKGVEFGPLIDYAGQRSRIRLPEEFGQATLLYSGPLGTALLLQLNTGVSQPECRSESSMCLAG